MLLHDPATLDSSALKALIESRVLAAPRTETDNDWRYGPVSPERRRHLRKFFPEQPVPAAVLVPIVERDEGLRILLTQRASHLSHHPGQISFPGGRLERLLAIPSTACGGITQLPHDLQQSRDGGGRILMRHSSSPRSMRHSVINIPAVAPQMLRPSYGKSVNSMS